MRWSRDVETGLLLGTLAERPFYKVVIKMMIVVRDFTFWIYFLWLSIIMILLYKPSHSIHDCGYLSAMTFAIAFPKSILNNSSFLPTSSIYVLLTSISILFFDLIIFQSLN